MRKLTGVVSVLAGFTFVFTFGSCSDGGDFTAKSYSTSENVQAITVEATDREIEIGISEDDMVYIDYYENEKEYYDILHILQVYMCLFYLLCHHLKQFYLPQPPPYQYNHFS